MATNKQEEINTEPKIELTKQELESYLDAKIAEALDAKSAAKETAPAGPTAEELARADELVEVELFKDNNLYKDDVFVGVNGENIRIKRGKRVKIKRKFADVLQSSMRQDSATADLTETLVDEFDSMTDALE